ncbi:MAG: hypothetical protein R2799_09550 [Crocinitomicaceae bacterium]
MSISGYSRIFLVLFAVILFNASCKKGSDNNNNNNNNTDTCNVDLTAAYPVEGFSILTKLPGIWNGPVYSPTPLGSFSEWIVDFRPISGGQVSAKNELDSLNDIFMSFFIVKYDCDYKMAFRNGGGFAGNVRSSYMILDSLNEGALESYYRFVDPVSGGTRVYTEITFKDDSLIMHTYTNQYNTLSEPVTHMRWTASLRDTNSTQNAITTHSYPQKMLTRDFSTTFDGLPEAVFYNSTSDPYPENEQPYLGVATINVNITNPATPDPSKKILYVITTQPLFNGFTFIPANLDYRSRYVLVSAQTSTSFDFNYMHPGDYYLNAVYDANGDLNFNSGDYINSNFDIPFTLTPEGTVTANATINFQIP